VSCFLKEGYLAVTVGSSLKKEKQGGNTAIHELFGIFQKCIFGLSWLAHGRHSMK
jgi:hypothetical protein